MNISVKTTYYTYKLFTNGLRCLRACVLAFAALGSRITRFITQRITEQRPPVAK